MSGCCCSSNQDSSCCADEQNESNFKKGLIFLILAVLILFSGIVMEFLKVPFYESSPYIPFLWNFLGFLLVGLPVFKKAFLLILKKDFFNELTLMSLATIGAFSIQYYSEGLGVMVFYMIGESFQDRAVARAKSDIKSLLDVRPPIAHVVEESHIMDIAPESATVGSIIEVRAGEHVPLDGELMIEKASFNTAALTGESVPKTLYQGDSVLAGMISVDTVIRMTVTKRYEDSTLARILHLVQDASQNKAPIETTIRKISRYYTPVVMFLSLLVLVVPFFVLGIENYHFKSWLYRSLVFLVMSCPCAFVISVPLGYFGGIGLGSRNGVLFKGGNFLEAFTKLKILVTDKTGTMTKAVFKVQDVVELDTYFLSYLASIESFSTHPIAKSIMEYAHIHQISIVELSQVQEISGHGLKAIYNHKELLAGSAKLMHKFGIIVPEDLLKGFKTSVFAAYDGKLLGALAVADELKDDAEKTIKELHRIGVKVIMLSGDKQEITQNTAQALGIDVAYGDLLPEGKAEYVESFKKTLQSGEMLAFIGDGINDAPVIALSDIGIAMGGLGSDLAIETADVIIQTDEPSKIITAFRVANITKNVVLQNIGMAFAVKLIILCLGAYDIATLWEAIFADVGVSCLAIYNAVRIQKAHVNL